MSAQVTTSLERIARQLWKDSGAIQQFGRCTCCGRVRDEETDRPLYVIGRRPDRLLCLRCHDERD